MYNLKQLQTHTLIDRVFRFYTDASIATGIAPTSICYALATGVYDGVSQDDLWPLFQAVKVHRVELWAAPSSNAVTTVAIDVTRTITDTTFQYTKHYEDTSISVSNPAHVVYRPRFGEYLYDWVSVNEGSSCLNLTGPSGTIVEIHISGIVNTRTGVAPTKKSNTTSSYPTMGLSPLDMGSVAGSRHILPTTTADYCWV
jgi:hypothetical protein